jgi:hypothetical protein
MRHALFGSVALMLVLMPAPQEPAFNWADFFTTAKSKMTVIANAETTVLPWDRQMRLLAYDAARNTEEITQWYVMPPRAATITPEQEQGWTAVLAPVDARERLIQVWAKTGTRPWRVLTVHVYNPWVWRSGIAVGESWVTEPPE